MEEWKTIQELNNRYEISNLGRVRKITEVIIKSNNIKYTSKPKPLTPVINNYGYYKVRCRISVGNVKNVYIHKLVAKYFVKGNNYLTVNHIDGNKSNNHYSNLEWISAGDNVRHAWNIGLSTNNHSKKPIIIDNRKYESYSEAAKDLNVSRETIKKRYLNTKLPKK